MTLVLLASLAAEARSETLLVNGATSDNIVSFDVTTGQAAVYATYNAGDSPRNLAVDSNGIVYASLNGGSQNVVRFVPNGTGFSEQNFTGTVSIYGPGQMQFYNGNLYAAADRGRAIDQFDANGNLVQSFSISTSDNIRAMTISGNTLYYGEYFHYTLVTENLSQSAPTGAVLTVDSTNMNEPVNMTIEADKNLFIAQAASPLIQEYNAATGQFE